MTWREERTASITTATDTAPRDCDGTASGWRCGGHEDCDPGARVSCEGGACVPTMRIRCQAFGGGVERFHPVPLLLWHLHFLKLVPYRQQCSCMCTLHRPPLFFAATPYYTATYMPPKRRRSTRHKAIPPVRQQDAEPPLQQPNHGPRLPTELLDMIVSLLDPVTDKSTLVALLQTSQTMWDLAAPHLYRRLRLDDEQLLQLLVGGTSPRHRHKVETSSFVARLSPRKGALTDRAKRAFGLIKHLHLCPPPKESFDLYMVSQPKVPLFPNVRILCLDGNNLFYHYPGHANTVPFDFAAFDHLTEVCIRGGSYSMNRMKVFLSTWRAKTQPRPHELYFMPRMDKTRNITIHCDDLSQIPVHNLPCAWESFRIFVLQTKHHDYFSRTMASTVSRLKQPPISILQRCVAEPKGRLPDHYRAIIGDNPPPCTVCGMSTQENSVHHRIH